MELNREREKRRGFGVHGMEAPTVAATAGVSESGRYECPTCKSFFCIDCDVFAHEVVHNCPGCQSREAVRSEQDTEDGRTGVEDRDENGVEAKQDTFQDMVNAQINGRGAEDVTMRYDS